MSNLLRKHKSAFSLLRTGQVASYLYEVRKQVWSEQRVYELRRDLSRPVSLPPASLPIALRPFQEDDWKSFAGPEGLWHRLTTPRPDEASRTNFIKAGFPMCYVAVDGDGVPCFIQWLFPSLINDKVEEFRKGYHPPLSDDEVLMEGAFVPDRFRGKRIMACAMSQVAEKAAETGARWAITFVEAWNIASLRGCVACGFQPHAQKKIIWRGFKPMIAFSLLEEQDRIKLQALWQRAPTGSPRVVSL